MSVNQITDNQTILHTADKNELIVWTGTPSSISSLEKKIFVSRKLILVS